MTHTYPAQTNVSPKPNDRFLDHAAEDFTGPVPSSEQQYRRDLLACADTQMSDDEQAALISRARAGDKSAREAIVLQLLPCVARCAYALARTYTWSAPTLTPDELVAVGNLILLETLEYALATLADALKIEKLFAYLMVAVKQQIEEYAYLHGGPISCSSRIARDAAPMVISYDMALNDEGYTLLDTLACETSSEPQETHFEEIGQALDMLSEQERTLICCLYGIDGPMFTIDDLSCTKQEHKRLENRRYHALRKLAHVLPDSFVQKHTTAVAHRAARAYEHAYIGEDRQRRLDEAYQAFLAQGVCPHGKMLAKQAHVAESYALAYLSRLGYTPRRGNYRKAHSEAVQA